MLFANNYKAAICVTNTQVKMKALPDIAEPPHPSCSSSIPARLWLAPVHGPCAALCNCACVLCTAVISLCFAPSCGFVIGTEEEWAVLFHQLCEYVHPQLVTFLCICVAFQNSPESRGKLFIRGYGQFVCAGAG